mmetsp:Transcript_25363/g.43326  ORF Transcript_25363/g.43326 Transcript_25363/m.43326 type:complete len:336 (+) Transcript_25363:107-1114(+)
MAMLHRRGHGGGEAAERPPTENEPLPLEGNALHDENGELVPQPTLMQEFIALHPLAYASVSARMLVVSAAWVLLLVGHCASLLLRSFPDEEPGASLTPLLRLACALRVFAAVPRPISWCRIYRLYRAALAQPTALRVAQRLITATQDRWVRWNATFNSAYNAWLALVSLRLAYGWWAHHAERCEFEVQLCWHVLACLCFLVASHLVSLAAMLHAIHSGTAEAQLHTEMVERCSTCETLTEPLPPRLVDDPCIVCFGDFEVGESVRTLSRCGHTFHRHCIDAWLFRPQHGPLPVSCPICATLVAEADELDQDDDPATARELAWLAELRRGHPGLLQ